MSIKCVIKLLYCQLLFIATTVDFDALFTFLASYFTRTVISIILGYSEYLSWFLESLGICLIIQPDFPCCHYLREYIRTWRRACLIIIFFASLCSAFCRRHKPVQNSPREQWIQATCAICLESLIEEGKCRDFLKMPCCTGNYMHKDCLQVSSICYGNLL